MSDCEVSFLDMLNRVDNFVDEFIRKTWYDLLCIRESAL